MCYMRTKGFKVALDRLEQKLISVTTLRKHRLSYAQYVHSSEGGWDERGQCSVWMFCQKGQINENLPPTSDSLQQHMKRGHYQACV